jgi:hypothetical protein
MLYLLLYSLIFFKFQQPNILKIRLYNVEHGIIYYSGHAITGATKTTVFFDEYGNRQRIVTDVNLGPRKKIIVIQEGGFQYTMMDSSQCIKSRRKVKFTIENIDFNSLDSQTIQKYGMKKNGVAVFLNRECTKYQFNNEQKISGTILEWRQIPLSIEVNNNTIRQKIEAFRLDTITKPSPKLFGLPEGIQIIDGSGIPNG